MALRVHLAKDETITFSKAPKSHVKPIKNMNDNNGFYLLTAVLFEMITKFGGLGPKTQDLVI